MTAPTADDCTDSSASFCPESSSLYEPWSTSICFNKRVHNSTVVGTIAQGCSVSCGCCGTVACNEINTWMPKVSARPGERFPLLLFSHSYGKSGQQALSEFFLEGLVDLKKFIVAAPNGREDDLGYPHWLATDGFTGHYVNVLNPKTQQMEEAPAPDFQHNASTKAQLEILTTKNPDIEHVKNTLELLISQLPVKTEEIYVFGHGTGADFAYQVSCQLSRYLKGVILFKAAGWTGVQSDFCKPSKPLHVLLVQDRRLYPSNDSTAAAPTSESDVVFTDIFGVPPNHPQGPVEARSVQDDNLLRFWTKRNACSVQDLTRFELPKDTINILQGDTGPGLMVDIPAMVLNATLDEQDDTRVFVMGRCSFHSSVTVWEVANTDPSSLDSGLFISELAQWLSHLPRGRPQQMSWLEAFFNWKGWVWLIWVPTISIYFCFHCGMCDTCYFNKRWRQPHEDSALLSQYGTIPTSEAPVEHMPDEKSNSIMSSGDVGQEVSCIREGSSVSEVVIAKP